MTETRAVYNFARTDTLDFRTVAEYFAGIGLVRLGLEQAGWRVSFANDISKQKYAMYRGYFDNAAQHYRVDDIFNLNPSEIPLTTLATCSFPCIDLSLAGNMNGIHVGKHSSAFWGFIQVLREQCNVSPPLVLVENVPGWLYSNNGNDFRITIKSLNDLGYACDAFVLDARHFTPQSRLRVFLVGVKTPPFPFSPEALAKRSKSLITDRLLKAIRSNSDLFLTTLHIPEPPPLRNTGFSELIVVSLSDLDDRWWPEDKVARHLEMMDIQHRNRVDVLIQKNRLSYRTFYRRIRNGHQRCEVRQDDIAGCLRTAVGGSSRQFLLAAGFGKVRMRNLTPREYARLQGVPEDYPIDVDENQALNGFGDAVCVPAISWIGINILNPLADKIGLAKSEAKNNTYANLQLRDL